MAPLRDDKRPAVYILTNEHQIKAGSRQKKIVLIDAVNPGWRDLFDEI